MLHKWKFILSNWINCYFNDTKTEECITVNTLLTIISHLHKNLNLDESKSSVLEAQNIEEFILEKYPDFKFGNGAVEPTNEEELYVVASLLLFFVCVISKDVDIKQAMCSRLSPDDQETIMRFSKCLMECSPVTYNDVEAAIIEACGVESCLIEKGSGGARGAGAGGGGGGPVAETPPALRSLHGEVRRLQASLDAERFDRNYLQEELARTTNRMEKLMKDKEQYKLEIVDLKAKLTMYSLEEGESRGSEPPSEGATRLARQLQDLEERLVNTQGQLDDTQYERDAYRAKINELKQERDKWLSVSQEKSSRSSQLTEELDAERRRVVTLQELVAELRQHHQNNCLDASQLECDDPDASIHTLHNTSVCSEACANVIEVQLAEERAKVNTLKQQLDILQVKIFELTQEAESNKLGLQNIIAEKDNDISNLKQRIDKEVQEKTSLTAHFNDEISKLTNEINEQEQKLKENNKNARSTIELKMQEIQTIQEEKISLLQTLSDETTKLENIIKDLKTDIDTEKNLKVQMRDDYENRLMKLNEKVLNRNNELVELQNKVFEKGEMIEMLNADLKKEKEMNHELSNRHNDEITKFNEEKQTLENNFYHKTEEAKELQKRLLQNVSVFNELNKEIEELKEVNENLLRNNRILEQNKESLHVEVQQRDRDLEGIRAEIESITNIFSEEKDKFMLNLEERSATISALQVRLQDEINYKMGLENELQNLHKSKMLLNEEVTKLNKELASAQADGSEKGRMIYALELYLKEERYSNLTLKNNNDKLHEEIAKISEEFSAKIKEFEERQANAEQELRNKDEALDYCNNKLLSEIEEKEALQLLLMSVSEEKEIINKDLIDRCSEIEKLQEDYSKLCNASEQNMKVIEALGNKIDNETKKYIQLEMDFDIQTSNLIAKLSKTEKTVKEISSKTRLKMEDKDVQIQALQIQVQNLNVTIENNSKDLETTFKEKEALITKLEEEKLFKNNIEKEYQNQCALLDNVSTQLNSEIALKSSEITSLRNEVKNLLSQVNGKTEEVKIMENKITQDNEASEQVLQQKNNEITQLKIRVEELHELNNELKKDIASKSQAIVALQRENEQLHYTIEEDNSNRELITKEKDVMIEGMEDHVKNLTISLEALRKDFEDSTYNWESTKIELQGKVETKDKDMVQLKDHIEKLKHSLEQVMLGAEELREEIKQKNEIIKEKIDDEAKLRQHIEEQITQITLYETKVMELQRSYENLKTELENGNAQKTILENEKIQLLKQNASLLEELYQEQSKSNKLLSENRAFEEENSNLCQQLSEEKSGRYLAEQEIKALQEAKTEVEYQVSDKEAIATSLLQDKELLKNEKDWLSQQLKSLKQTREKIFEEKRVTEQELTEKVAVIKSILEENKNLNQQVEIIELVKQARLSDKQAMEQQLVEKELASTALLDVNKQLSLEKEAISQELESSKTNIRNLLAEKQTTFQQLVDEKNAREALLLEKENLAVRLDSEVQIKTSLLKEKKDFEKQLLAREATLKVLTDEKEQLLISIENLSEQLETSEIDKQTLLTNKEIVLQKLNENESHQKTLMEEKECLQMERMSLSNTLESVLAEKQTIQQALEQETAEKTVILETKECLNQQLLSVLLEKENLLDEKQHSEKMAEEIATKEAYLKEKEFISERNEILQQQLNEEFAEKTALLAEKQSIVQKLEHVKEAAECEKEGLISNTQALQKKIEEETTAKMELIEVREYLKKQVELLEREKLDLLSEKESSNQNMKQEMKQFAQKLYKEQAEKQILQQQLNEELTSKNIVLEVKEYLSRQLIEEKTAKELLEQEKETLYEDLCLANRKLIEEIEHKSKLEEERHYLLHEKNELIEARNQEISDLNEQIEQRNQEIAQVNQLLDKEKSLLLVLREEKVNLLNEIESLKHESVELNSIKEILLHDKEVMNIEKEQLLQSLTQEKASRDELESEKEVVCITLEDLNEKYAMEIKDKQDQLSTMCGELKQVKTDLKKHEDLSVHIATVVNSGLDKLLQNIDKEKIDNKVLQNLVNFDQNESIPLSEKCSLVINIADTLSTELAVRRNLEKALEHESTAVNKLKDMIKEKEMQALELHSEVKTLQKAVKDGQDELTKQTEIFNATLDSKVKDIQSLQLENKSLNRELNDVKVQLDVKVHSLKEKLIDNENLTEKLKKTYECQIENLNVMVNKLTCYLKEKTCELDMIRKEKEKLQKTVDESNKAIHSLEEEVKTQKANQKKLITDFESERQVIKNMVTVTESIMEDQKVGLNKVIADYEKTLESYQSEKKVLEQLIDTTQKTGERLVQEKQCAFDAVFTELTELRKEKDNTVKKLETFIESLNKEIAAISEELVSQKSDSELLETENAVMKQEKEQLEKDIEIEREKLLKEIEELQGEMKEKVSLVESLKSQNEVALVTVNKLKDDMLCLQENDKELQVKKECFESELLHLIEKITNALNADTSKNDKFKYNLQEKLQSQTTVQEKMKVLTNEVLDLVKEKNEYISKLDEAKAEAEAHDIKAKEEIDKWRAKNSQLSNAIEENKIVISRLERQVECEKKQTTQLREDSAHERLSFENRCSLLQEYQTKAEKQLQERDKEIAFLKQSIKTESALEQAIEELKEDLSRKDTMITEIAQVKDEVIDALNKELMKEKAAREKYQKELEFKVAIVQQITQKLEDAKSEASALQKQCEENKVSAQRDTSGAAGPEITSLNRFMELRDRHQVSTTSDLTQSSMESLKTITDLEKIIHDKNRTITTLQSDITYMKSLMAESENKLLDITKELEISKESCEQLSIQLKKLAQQKNEEISDLKKQVLKMSATENRATQIIKVSAKYQAIILKRIAEIKSNTILKELTNFGNTANCDSELKRNLNSGAITLEDLENFLETTDKHLKRCSDKQVALQKERDRLNEVNKINESEIINMKKFLTELSVSFKTFNSIKDLYTQKLSRVVSMQRTVRREILSLDGQVTDSVMCKLERGYAAVMQDLCECSMNLERWVERSIARTISSEKIKQAFTSDTESGTRAATTFQNASLEVQLEELENSFQKLLEDVVRAQKSEGAKDAQATTVMEVRAEYEDKLNRMKAKMKQLYQDQIQVFKNKQKEEIAHLELELQKTRDRLAESSRAYEEHIKALTAELWSVGEKFLMKKDEAEWLRRKKSESLMSLQHLHSTGLTSNHEDPTSPSDTQSLRSLPVIQGMPRPRNKREGRGLHMSDEEGEVFDNRCLKELTSPGRPSTAGCGQRLSELRWRNSLCPPHLKSSYPAEMQFTNTLDEEDIKSAGAPSLGRSQRKEVGITAYKKPGPPTPSKQAGRLSATDSDLRESLRVEPEPSSRKTSTPGRIRAFFRSARDNTDLPESEYPICGTSEYLKCGTSEYPKSDSEPLKRDNSLLHSEITNLKKYFENRIPKSHLQNRKTVNLENRFPKCDTEISHPKCDTENRKLVGSETKCDTENRKTPDSVQHNSKYITEIRKSIDSKQRNPKCDIVNQKPTDSEQRNPKCDIKNRKPINSVHHNSKHDSENRQLLITEECNPKCDTENRKPIGSVQRNPKCDTENRRPVNSVQLNSTYDKGNRKLDSIDSEQRNPKCDTVHQKPIDSELRNLKCDIENRNPIHYVQHNSKHDDENRKLLAFEERNPECDVANRKPIDSVQLNPKCDTKNRKSINSVQHHSKCNKENRKIIDSEQRNPKYDTENRKPNSENLNPKCDIENKKLLAFEERKPECDVANRKPIDSVQLNPKCDTRNRKSINSVQHNSKCSKENRKVIDSEQRNLEYDTENRISIDSEHHNSKQDTENRKPNLEKLIPKCDLENRNAKRGSETPKIICDFENQNLTCETEVRKNGWFKLNLRQRAALWEPLAKD